MSKVPPPAGLRIPEDVARLVVDEILHRGDSRTFHTASLISLTFLYVAQCHLYRSCTLNLRDPFAIHDLRFFLDILRRRPYVQTFVKEFKITDHYSTELIPRHRSIIPSSNDEHHTIPTFVMQDPLRYRLPSFLELMIYNTHDLLPQFLRQLSCLSKAALAFSHQFLDWQQMHPRVRDCLGRILENVKICVHIVGARNVPVHLSAHLLTLNNLHLDRCQFDGQVALSSLPRTVQSHPRQNLHLSFAPSCTEGAKPWSLHWASIPLKPPIVQTLSLEITDLGCVNEIASVLGVFCTHIKELTLSTTALELGYLQIQPPPNPSFHSSTHQLRLPHIHQHGLGDCFSMELPFPIAAPFQTHLEIAIAENKEGWLIEALEILQPRFYQACFQNLRKLSFLVSHWRSAKGTEANGELLWVALWLADLPLDAARRVEELTVAINVGADFCLDNANAFTELTRYEGWTLWDVILADQKWEGLTKVNITVQSRTTCIYELEGHFQGMMGALQKRCFPRLNRKCNLSVDYIAIGGVRWKQ